jgi:hypothetical protein
MVTNFFRIVFPFESFKIQRIPYSEDRFEALKRNYNRDSSFFRHGDFAYASPRKGASLELGERVTVKIEESPNIVLSLIRHLVFRSFRQEFPSRIPETFSPLRFFSAKEEHDAIRKYLPSELQGKVSYPRMIEVEARSII